MKREKERDGVSVSVGSGKRGLRCSVGGGEMQLHIRQAGLAMAGDDWRWRTMHLATGKWQQ